MPFPVNMSLHSKGIKPPGFSKDLVLGTEGLNVSIHREKRNREGSDDEEGETRSLKKLLDRHLSEENELQKKWQERKDALEKKHRLESAVVRSINRSEEVLVGKLKLLEAKHRQMLAEIDSEMSILQSDMKARHCAEREAKEKEGVCKMTEDRLLDNLHSKLAEAVPAKTASLSGNINLAEEKINELGSVDVHVQAQLLQPHKDAAEKSGSADDEAVAIDVDIERTANTVNDEANQVEQTATSKNVLLSAENPTLHTDANEESTSPVREEQNVQPLQKSTHIQPIVSPSVAQPVLNIQPQVNTVPASQEHATSHETSRNILPSSDYSDRMPGQAVHVHLPPQHPVPAISHPIDPIRRCSVSSSVLVTLPTTTTPHTTSAAPNQEDHRRPNSSLPASPQFNPLHREYERMRGEANQVCKNHEETVQQLKSERDKEIEELVGGIRRKYESMVKESEASSMQKKRELEHIKFKLVMNMKLAEAIRSKYLDITTAPTQQVASHAFPQNVNLSMRSQPQTQPQPQPQLHVARPNSLQERISAGPTAEGLLTSDGVICLSDDDE